MPKYLEIEVSLRGTRPRIWRKFLIARTATFADLDDAIQVAMGWLGDHLWEFRTTSRGDVIVGVELQDPDWGAERKPDARKVKIEPVLRARRKVVYIYDFGDGWVHDVVLKREVSLPETFRRRLLKGRRACPPEDVGGISGYDAACQFVETGKHPWHGDDFRDWLGGWSPEAFEFEEIQKAFDR